MNGRRPPLSRMTDRLTREAAAYQRPFVVKGRSAWFAFAPSGPSAQSYGVRGCPTWAEAYAWALGKADRCAVCGNCSHDHGGWTHTFTTGGKVATRDMPDYPSAARPMCTWNSGDMCLCHGGPGCQNPGVTAPPPVAARPECGWRLGLCTGCEKCEPVEDGRCSNCLVPVGLEHEQGCRYEHPRQLTHGEWTPSEGP